MDFVLRNKTGAIESRKDDVGAILVGGNPFRRDAFGKLLIERFDKDCTHGLCMLVLLSVDK